jgi:hypothetical protein
MYTIFTFPAGKTLDNYGPRIGITIGVSLIAAGVWIRCLINQSFLFIILGFIL